MITNLNGTEYVIEQFREGWAWVTKDAEAEGGFPEPYQALQDAMRHASEEERKAAEEDEEDDGRMSDVEWDWKTSRL
ncbi:hypothetical protein [Singulisphaera sp. PoT]|uniref:hypothetical protein n=1 Tax=Singulisphaera sp. PoT TaxID=3411797 RepID=UPI003BF4ECAA